MTTLERLVRRLIRVEGAFSDHPADSGGKTRWGVTEFLARAHGYTGDMRAYPIEAAFEVYRLEYFDRMHLAEIAALSEEIAYELLDTEVNTPFGTASTFLQRLLNALNQQGTLYPDLKVDGRIGPATLDALTKLIAKRGKAGERALLRALNGLQTCYYTELVERRQKDEAFYFGWITNRIEIA